MTASQADRPAGDADAAVDAIARRLARQRTEPAAVVHRVVHGGPHHDLPTRVDDTLLDDLRAALVLTADAAPARRRWSALSHGEIEQTELRGLSQRTDVRTPPARMICTRPLAPGR